MSLRTVLRRGEASVEMVEHLLAALAGLQIDNCEVWVDRPEMPGCDGSALPFVEALRTCGTVEQDRWRRRHVIRRPLRLGNENSWIEVRPCCSGKMVLGYVLDYGGGSPIGRQSLEVSLSPRHFHMNLAPSRTFLLESEALAIHARGLGRRTTFRDLLVFGPHGLIDNQLRFPDECARHKLVDLVGDLALAGCDLAGRFAAYRSGHQLNAELVRAIVAEMEEEEEENQQPRRRCA
jgi:UDP-3-O-acyl N-acetylglucosamine deacetylase